MSNLFKINNYPVYNRFILLLCIFLLTLSHEVSAQEPPPRPIVVTVAQDLSFGAFSIGSGGTVTISSGGMRSFTDDIYLLTFGYSYSAAIFRLVGNAGTVITVLNGADVQLDGSDGGFMMLHIDDSNPESPFVLTSDPPDPTLLYIGGTLTVGDAFSNPPGSYEGNFDITFFQE